MYTGIIHNAHWFLSFGQFVVEPQSLLGAPLPLLLRPLQCAPLSMPVPLPQLPHLCVLQSNHQIQSGGQNTTKKNRNPTSLVVVASGGNVARSKLLTGNRLELLPGPMTVFVAPNEANLRLFTSLHFASRRTCNECCVPPKRGTNQIKNFCGVNGDGDRNKREG